MSDAIICNAGPLIALGGVARLELLRDLFGHVWVPAAVRDEVVAGGVAGLGTGAFLKADWIRIADPNRLPDQLLSAFLDVGEAAVVSLALERSASLVLLDDQRARRIARDVYRLRVIGTGRVLVEGKRRGLIGPVNPLLDQIRSNGYWIAERLMNRILLEANELTQP